MKLTRVRIGSETHLARIESDHVVLLHRESSHPAADALREALAMDLDLSGKGPRVDVTKVRILSPVRNPAVFLGVGLNYREHAAEGGLPIPSTPIYFVKTPNTIIGHRDVIEFDRRSTGQVDYEVELAVVLGRRLRSFDEEAARHAVLGYTVCNDVTARDVQFSDGQWPRAKSFDTFGPLGPWIVTPDEFSPADAVLTSRLNGIVMQNSSTSDMVFTAIEIIAYAARSMTLQPGDVITTGTPPGVGFARKPPVFLADGDLIEVAIEGIGSLENTVREIHV